MALAIRVAEAILGTAAVAWFTLQLVAENPAASTAWLMLQVGLAGGLSYLLFVGLVAAGRRAGRIKFLAVPVVAALGLFGATLAVASPAQAATLPPAAPPQQTITTTITIDEIPLPSGATGAVEYRVTAGELIISALLLIVIGLNLHMAIQQAARESSA